MEGATKSNGPHTDPVNTFRDMMVKLFGKNLTRKRPKQNCLKKMISWTGKAMSCLYINARYGSGGSLDRGTIEKIKFNVQKYEYNDAESETVHVIIRNDNGQKSDIKRPELSILKLKDLCNEN
jgi:hypothetical protein